MIILPVLYFSYSNLFQDGRAEIWYTEHGIYLPLVRGLADLSLGVLVCVAYHWISDKHIYSHKITRWIIEIFSITAILVLIIYPANLDHVVVVLMCVFIIVTASEDSFCEKIGSCKIVKWFSQYEYAIFLNHAVVLLLFRKYIVRCVEWRVSILSLVLLTIVTIYSIASTKLIKYILQRIHYILAGC